MEHALILGLLGALLALGLVGRAARRRLVRSLRDARERCAAAQAAAERAQERLGWLEAVVEEMLLVVDDELRVLYSNPAAEAFFTPAPGADTLITYSRSLELERLAADALQGGPSEGLERTLHLVDRACRAVAHPVAGGVALAVHDVAEMQRLTRARQDLIANLSHELRTPLTSLRLLADTLLAPAGQDPAVARDLAEKVAAEVALLQEMTEEMLDLAAIESGQQVVRLVAVPLAEVVAEPLKRSEQAARRRGIRLQSEIPADLKVLADPAQAARAVRNVLENAVKFSPPQGEIVLRAAERPGEGRVVLTVADGGPGIPPDELERVFERFFRGDRARVAPGTGLGLAIARHILRAHGGRIWAENRPAPESGALFHLAFRTP